LPADVYGAVNALYLLKSLAAILLKLGRFGPPPVLS